MWGGCWRIPHGSHIEGDHGHHNRRKIRIEETTNSKWKIPWHRTLNHAVDDDAKMKSQLLRPLRMHWRGKYSIPSAVLSVIPCVSLLLKLQSFTMRGYQNDNPFRRQLDVVCPSKSALESSSELQLCKSYELLYNRGIRY